jgi:hypothetical protein
MKDEMSVNVNECKIGICAGVRGGCINVRDICMNIRSVCTNVRDDDI